MRIKTAAIVAMSLASSVASALDLERGVVKTRENTYELTQTTSAKAYAYGTAMLTHRNSGDQGVVAFYIQDGLDRVISLSRGTNLYATDLENDNVLSSWSLSRWPSEPIPLELSERLEKEGAFEPGPEPVLSISTSKTPIYGCLAHTPLRFGDIDRNGSSELVVFLDRDIVLFSPEKGKTLFQLRWLDERYSGYTNELGEPMELDPDIREGYPQFIDPFTKGQLYPGMRIYAKFYVGDFNESGNPDILVWQKVYQSNDYEEADGFHLVDDYFHHYELQSGAEGEYQPQVTDENTIRDWLAERELTWKKGYPSQSECEGEEGDLIPEMHDPLLNDSDVLQ